MTPAEQDTQRLEARIRKKQKKNAEMRDANGYYPIDYDPDIYSNAKHRTMDEQMIAMRKRRRKK